MGNTHGCFDCSCNSQQLDLAACHMTHVVAFFPTRDLQHLLTCHMTHVVTLVTNLTQIEALRYELDRMVEADPSAKVSHQDSCMMHACT